MLMNVVRCSRLRSVSRMSALALTVHVSFAYVGLACARMLGSRMLGARSLVRNNVSFAYVGLALALVCWRRRSLSALALTS